MKTGFFIINRIITINKSVNLQLSKFSFMSTKNDAADQIKRSVKEKYSAISKQSSKGCCTSSKEADYTIFADDYSKLKGYTPDADLGLGCGLPTEFAHIKEGDTVVDLGSGAGNDCFVARQVTGDSGRVIGIDMTESMVEKARINAKKLNYENVEFISGDIEQMPIDDETADVVVSNCVLNLVPDKEMAFSETYRILKRGGHFSISDIITKGELAGEIKSDAEMYAGCVAGAIDKDEYIDIVKQTGFRNLEIQKIKEIYLPDDLLKKSLSDNELEKFRQSYVGIYSITLYAEK